MDARGKNNMETEMLDTGGKQWGTCHKCIHMTLAVAPDRHCVGHLLQPHCLQINFGTKTDVSLVQVFLLVGIGKKQTLFTGTDDS
jgi:hypothetical protein